MKVILAEKPSVAREIAAYVGAGSRHEGYLEGQGYQVTWAFGHLVTLKEPGEYDPALKQWSLDTLPFVPQEFQLKLIDDARSRKQFAIIKRLFRNATELICATDAGREGELIFRYILSMSGCQRKPFRRLWLSSLTRAAIGHAFNHLQPGAHYDNLYAAAKCRSESDWIVGLNATRAYTVRYGQQGLLWSVGRVQTPVLAMIAARDDEIRTFKPQPFWELMTRYRDVTFKFAGDRFAQEDKAQQLLVQVQGHPFAIDKVEPKQQQIQPPQLYDLTELQRDMNRRFGLSAADTLQTAQSLYEKKLITYPRTDSRYLTGDMKKEVPRTLRQLMPIREQAIAKLDLSSLRFSGRIVNDKKVTDHHAIIPTGDLPGQLSSREQRVYDAIVTRLIAAFYPPCLKEITVVHGTSNRVPFQARGVRVVQQGWTELYPRPAKDKEDDDQTLPTFVKGENGPHEPFVRQGETTPPRPFTENTLLGVMETAGKLVDDDQLKEALKERGLGTPATRASIIETLLKRGYIQRSKKTLCATDLGRYLVAIVRDRNLKSADLTGQWEAELKDVEAGRLDAGRFMAKIVEYTREVVRAGDDQKVDENRLGDCPRCGRPVIQGKRGFGCSGWKDGCTFVLWPTFNGHDLSASQVKELIQRRVLLGPIESSGAPKMILTLADSGDLLGIPVPEANRQSQGKRRGGTARQTRKSTGGGRKSAAGSASGSIGACPLCGKAVVEQKKSFSCSDWKQGCQFVIWKTISGKRISARTARSLLSKGQTSVLKGFQSKAGKPFEARLKLIDGQVRFEFDS